MKLAKSLLALILLALLAAPQNAVLAAESVLFVQPTNGVPIPAPLDGSNYIYVDCPACTGLASPTGLNNADNSVSVATGLTTTQTFLYGYDAAGGNWDRLRLDASDYLNVNCQVGCSGGSFNNNADGVATSATNGQAAAWLYGWNGLTWDRLLVDASKYLDVNVQVSALPAGASTSALQTTGNTSAATTATQTTTTATNTGTIAGAVTASVMQNNLKQVNGTTTDSNSGTKSAGTLRVVIATDQPALTNKLLVTPDSVALPANQSVNISQMNGVTTTMGNGTSGTGVQRVTIASDSTGVVQSIGAATGGISVSSKQVPNNTTSVAIDASAGTLYGVTVFNNSATIAYLKLYNTAQGSVTCGTPTPVQRILIPANTSGAGAVIPFPVGIAYGTALTACVTTGFADNDTTAPAANAYITEFYYK